MSFFAGLVNVLGDAAQARVRAEAQKQASRQAGRRNRDPGCTPCAANQKVIDRYNANQAARAKR
jgi:hypothetical protein